MIMTKSNRFPKSDVVWVIYMAHRLFIGMVKYIYSNVYIYKSRIFTFFKMLLHTLKRSEENGLRVGH